MQQKNQERFYKNNENGRKGKYLLAWNLKFKGIFELYAVF